MPVSILCGERLANRHGLIERSADQIGGRSSEGLSMDQVKAVSQLATDENAISTSFDHGS
jgi:hypothetical protein